MTVAVVGSRTWTDAEAVWRGLAACRGRGPVRIITGDCPTGVDALVGALEDVRVYVADWLSYGKSAGPRRNARLVADADIVLAFRMPGRSPGTDDVIRQALRARKELHVYYGQTEDRP